MTLIRSVLLFFVFCFCFLDKDRKSGEKGMNELIREQIRIRKTYEMVQNKRQEIVDERERIRVLNGGSEKKSNYLCSF